MKNDTANATAYADWNTIDIQNGDVFTTPILRVHFLETPMPSTEAMGPVITVDETGTGGAAVLSKRKNPHLHSTHRFVTQNASSINLFPTVFGVITR